LEVPFFLLQGESDVITLTSLAEEYFEEVEAPTKGLALINDAGHFAAFTQPRRFLIELRTRSAHWRPRPISRPCPRCDRTTITLGGQARIYAQPIRRRFRTRTYMLERVPGKSTATVAPTTGQWPEVQARRGRGC
jgi:hypothetical protein